MGMLRRLLTFLILFTALLSVLRPLVKSRFQPVAVVVPHHDIVADIRTDFLARISRDRPVTKSIVLLSPDHFSPDQTKIFYSDQDWRLHNGELKFDSDLGSQFTQTAFISPELVKKDHGIFNILGDIRSNFPAARVVPFLIGQKVSRKNLDVLSEKINRYCLSTCLLIASVDFSHYLPAHLADIHDLYSQKILQRFDIDNYPNLEVDSPQSLYLVMQFAASRKAGNFNVFDHTNSGHITGNPDAESTSHLFASYSPKLFPPAAKDYSTFTLANGLIRNSSVKTVGDRFFYGVDYIDPDINSAYFPSTGIEIIPATTSSVIVTDGWLRVTIGKDLTVSGTVSPTGSTLLFLPLDASTSSFLRGPAKLNALENLFSPISSSSGFIANIEFGIIKSK